VLLTQLYKHKGRTVMNDAQIKEAIQKQVQDAIDSSIAETASMYMHEKGCSYEFARMHVCNVIDYSPTPESKIKVDSKADFHQREAAKYLYKSMHQIKNATQLQVVLNHLDPFKDIKKKVTAILSTLQNQEEEHKRCLDACKASIEIHMNSKLKELVKPISVLESWIKEVYYAAGVIDAIKLYRELTGCGLKEAKDYVVPLVGHTLR
jgi:ribosomal protein L7/L12